MPRQPRNVVFTVAGLSLLAQVVFSPVVLADVYKYTDAQGKVQYTDKPKTLPAERIGMQSRRTDESAVQEREDAERRRQQEANDRRRDSAGQQSEQRQDNATPAKDKTQLCNEARETYAKYMSTQRMYENLPNGERKYLSPEDMDKARATSKTLMDNLCK